MDAEIPKFHETLEGQLGRHLPDLQVFSDGQEGHIHNKRHRITELHLSEAEPSEERISERYSPVESPVSGDL